MPNHITNRITAHPAVLARIREVLRSDGKEPLPVDFNRLIPMPDDIERGDLTLQRQRETKGRNWYDWSIENWGTKWNAYSVDVSDDAIQFDTAWEFPEPIVRALAAKKLGPWTWEYADEAIGDNCGTITCDADGKLTTTYPDDPERFAIRVKGWDWDEYMADRDA